MIIDRMRERMSAEGFSQSDLAREAGCTQGTIQQILDGTTRRSRMLPEIARALNTTVEYLTGTSDRATDDPPDRATDGEGVETDVNTKGNEIRRYRKAARLSVNEVAQMTGLGSSSLFHWEKGRRNVEMREAWTLAKAIHAPLSAVSPELGRIAIEAAAAEGGVRSAGGDDIDDDVTAWLAARDRLAAARPSWTAAELNEAASSIAAMRKASRF